MKKTCNINGKFMQGVDLFGKEAELYYKGKSKRTSCPGIFFYNILCFNVYCIFYI